MGDSRKMRYASNIARMRYKARAYDDLVEKSVQKKKRPYGSPNRKTEDNIKM